MLRAISDAGEGVYYFIESEESVAEAFADCLGGLLSVVAQNITLKFEAKNGARIKQMLTKYKVETVTAGSHYVVRLGDLQSEEQRDILCSVILPALQEPNSNKTPVVNAQLDYFNVITSLPESIAVDSLIERPSEVSASSKQVPKAIDMQRNRVRVSEALEKANQFATANKIEDAKKILQDTIKIIQASSTASEDFVKGLINDLNDCLSRMADQSQLHHGGLQALNNYQDIHSKQRSAKASPSPASAMSSNSVQSAPSYQTKAKAKMVSKFQQH